MKLTYKRELFFGERKNNLCMIAGGLIIMIALSMPFASGSPFESLTSVVMAPVLMFFAIGMFVFWLGIKDAANRRRRYLLKREEMMSRGYLSKGKIVDANTKISMHTEYTNLRDKNNRRESFTHWNINHCIEVEYYDEQLGIYKRFTAQGLNKNAKLHGMVGKEVEVYKYDDFIYINIP